MQKGHIYRKGPSWFLACRETVLVDGQRVTKTKQIKLAPYCDQYRSKKDVRPLADEILSAMESANRCPQSSILFTEYVEQVWLPYRQRAMTPSTASGNDQYYRQYVRPYVQGVRLRDFDTRTTSRVLESAALTGKLNRNTVGKIRSTLQAVFTFAISKGDYPARSQAENPARGALIPETATEPKPTKVHTLEEFRAQLRILEGVRRVAIALVALAGFRPGEDRAIRWTDWNRTENQLLISKSVWHTHEGPTKTKQSATLVAVAPVLHDILVDWWKKQGCPKEGIILARRNGVRVNLENMSKRELRPRLKAAGVPWYGFYGLRRLHGTAVQEFGKSIETTARALRNSPVVANRHYVKLEGVPPDVRRAVNGAFVGLIDHKEADCTNSQVN